MGAVGIASLPPGRYFGEVTQRSLHAGIAVSQIEHRSARRGPRHVHESTFISTLVAGRYAEEIGHRVYEYELFTVAAHPPGFAHRDWIGTAGGRFFNLDFDNQWSPAWPVDLSALSPGPLSAAASVLVAQLYRAHRLGIINAEETESVAWELISEALYSRERSERGRPRWLDRCLELLQSAIQRPIMISDVAQAVDIHPGYLSREFRRRFGRGIGQYLAEMRIRRACGLLAEDSMTLAHIAAVTGFADQSHFTRVFHALIGCSPGRYRRLISSRIQR
jgi:AraC family transcriptional regulator